MVDYWNNPIIYIIGILEFIFKYKYIKYRMDSYIKFLTKFLFGPSFLKEPFFTSIAESYLCYLEVNSTLFHMVYYPINSISYYKYPSLIYSFTAQFNIISLQPIKKCIFSVSTCLSPTYSIFQIQAIHLIEHGTNLLNEQLNQAFRQLRLQNKR